MIGVKGFTQGNVHNVTHGHAPDGKTLDRIDNEGNYEPDNCKWSTLSEQQLNRRCSKEVH